MNTVVNVNCLFKIRGLHLDCWLVDTNGGRSKLGTERFYLKFILW